MASGLVAANSSISMPPSRAPTMTIRSEARSIRKQRYISLATCVPASMYTLEQSRSEEHTSELQSPCNLVCRLLLEKKTYLVTTVPQTPAKKTDIAMLGALGGRQLLLGRTPCIETRRKRRRGLVFLVCQVTLAPLA